MILGQDIKVTMTLEKLRNCIQNSPLCDRSMPRCLSECTFGDFCALNFTRPVGSVEFCTNENIYWITGRAKTAFDKLMAFIEENGYLFSDDFCSIHKAEGKNESD